MLTTEWKEYTGPVPEVSEWDSMPHILAKLKVAIVRHLLPNTLPSEVGHLGIQVMTLPDRLPMYRFSQDVVDRLTESA